MLGTFLMLMGKVSVFCMAFIIGMFLSKALNPMRADTNTWAITLATDLHKL